MNNQDPFEMIKNNKDQFDLSDYPKNHELYDAKNKKVIGKFKNESINQITEFVGLRSKLYSYSVDSDKKDHSKCKGVKSSVVKQEIKLNDYKNTLFKRQEFSIKQNGFRSYKHQIYTETVKKVALSFNDDKCYVTNNNVNTYTFGHYKIQNK